MPDQVHRPILEDPRGLSASVVKDFAALGSWRGSGHASRMHRRGIRQRLMPVQAVDEYGIVRGDGVDPAVLRQRGAGPQRVIPVAAGDPLTGLESRRVLFQPANEFL